jgi:general secretion pathway protein L
MVLLGLTVLLSLAWGGSSIMQEKMELDRLNVQLGNLEGQISQVDAVRQSCNEVEERISYLEKQYRGHISVLEMLRDLSERVPEGAWVSDFRFARRGLELKGFADEASELIQLLEESPLFRDAAFLSPIVKTTDGKESFLIGLKVAREN